MLDDDYPDWVPAGSNDNVRNLTFSEIVLIVVAWAFIFSMAFSFVRMVYDWAVS